MCVAHALRPVTEIRRIMYMCNKLVLNIMYKMQLHEKYKILNMGA
jgi:hypothetical protein